MSSPTPTPVEKFACIMRGLTLAVAARSMWGPLSSALLILIQGRFYRIRHQIYRLIERIQAGTYVPRRAARRRAAAAGRARQPGPLTYSFGWLEPLLPETIQFRAALHTLLQDPEMVALIQAAPAAMGRPLRSLCWMLRLQPPPILARPRPAAPPPAPPPDPPPEPAPDTATQALPAQPPPARAKTPRAKTPPTRRPPPRACGPPLPA